MFLKSEKRSHGWSFIVLGLFFCALSLVGLSGMLGFVPSGGRAGTLSLLGLPFGIVSIIIGVVALLRDARR